MPTVEINGKKFLDYEGTQFVVNELIKKINKKLDTADYEQYNLPAATTTTLGGVKVGDGLNINAEGVLTAVEGISSWNDLTDKPTTLAELGIEDAASAEDIEALKAKLTGVYHFRGSVADMDALNAIEEPAEGDVYNVEADGMNYGFTAEGTWDALGAAVNLEGYLQEDDIVAISQEELDVIMGVATSANALKALIANSTSGELSEDLVLDEQLVIPAGKNFTLNLNDHNLTCNDSMPAVVVNGGTLTLKGDGEASNQGIFAVATNGGRVVVNGGDYNSVTDYAFAAQDGGKVVINDASIESQEGGVGAFTGGQIEINGGVISARDNFAIFTNGSTGKGGNTIIMNGGSLVSNIVSGGYEACGVYVANNDTFVMNGGEILANNGCGILMRGGNVTINDGTVVATGVAGTSGWVGDNKTKMSKSAVIFHETANYPGNADMQLHINGGTFIGVDHAVEVLSDAANPAVEVVGGTFSPAYPEG